MPGDRAPDVLRLLASRHNVLISGPPGTGKSRLLGEVASAFDPPVAVRSGPVVEPAARVAIPATPPVPPLPGWYPSASRTNRRVFSTVFHQNTKHRDFVSGLVPGVTAAGASLSFRVQIGKLIEAAEHALRPDGASLLIIDEINRGPAVQIFGGAIVAMESDKRLDETGNARRTTQTFDMVHQDGSHRPFALPHHLYILAAMNQADTSVEALDVAFLRRWTPFYLPPEVERLHQHFGLPNPLPALPASPSSDMDVYAAAVAAWVAVNARIRIGKGAEYQIGHGVLMGAAPPTGVDDALSYIKPGWEVVKAHVEEVFFGDVRSIAAALNVGGATDHPLSLATHTFAEQPRLELQGALVHEGVALYRLLRSVAA